MEALPCSSEEQTIRSCFVAERMMSKVFKCDTLEELAKAMGVPDDKMDTFMASIDEYNAMCDAGKDDKFGKDASALIPIREAPFYGCAQTLGNRSASPSMVTMNGMMPLARHWPNITSRPTRPLPSWNGWISSNR